MADIKKGIEMGGDTTQEQKLALSDKLRALSMAAMAIGGVIMAIVELIDKYNDVRKKFSRQIKITPAPLLASIPDTPVSSD